MDEFEIMRRQLASMKQQLDSQQIVNQELMCKVMRSKASWMNLFVKAELITMPFVYLLFVAICYEFNISQWYSFAFLIFGGLDSLCDIRTVRIPNNLFSSESILGLKKFLVRQKKERFIQTCISGTLCIAYLILLNIALFTSTGNLILDDGLWNAAKTGGLIGGIVGLIAALVVVVILYRKIQRTNDQILADIDELEKGE